MSRLDAQLVRDALTESSAKKLDALELFGSIASTNTYLLTRDPPPPGKLCVALAEHQTSGRGRHSRRWVSPPMAGLNLSLAYTFAVAPGGLPALTLAAGVAVVEALASLRVEGIQLKWPNDLVAEDRKLGGILTETQARKGDDVTVVIGIGINMTLPKNFDVGLQSEWSTAPIDMRSLIDEPPRHEFITASIINTMLVTIEKFENGGIAAFAAEWSLLDWLAGKSIRVLGNDETLVGTANGVDATGRLLVATEEGERSILSGSVILERDPPRSEAH